MDTMVLSVVRSLFAVSLDLTSARSLIDGDAGKRVDRALDELDAITADLRARAVAEHPSCRSPADARRVPLAVNR